MQVRGYPTLKLFHDNLSEGKKYAGGRDKKSLANFVRDELEAFKQSGDEGDDDGEL